MRQRTGPLITPGGLLVEIMGTTLALAVCAVAVLAIFFAVPLVGFSESGYSGTSPCNVKGYESLSLYLFSVGAAYYQGHFSWNTHALTIQLCYTNST